MHFNVQSRRITGTGTKDKVAVMGIIERGGNVKTIVVQNRKKAALQAEVKKHVKTDAALYPDALLSYEGLASDYAIRLWTTPLKTLTVTSTPIIWKTSGHC